MMRKAMKKLNFAILLSLSVLSTQGFSQCNYDLEGFAINPYEPTAQKFPIIMGQKISYKILNSPNQIMYVANHSTLKITNETIVEGGLTLPRTGIVGFELNTDIIPIELKNSINDTKSYAIFTQDKDQNKHSILITYSNNTALSYQDNKKNVIFILIISTDPNTKNGQALYGYGMPIEGIALQNIGIYFNQNTNQIGMMINKNNLGYVATLPSKPKDFTIVPQALFSGFEASSPYLNKTMSIELITDKSKFTNTFPTGTKDLCGN